MQDAFLSTWLNLSLANPAASCTVALGPAAAFPSTAGFPLRLQGSEAAPLDRDASWVLGAVSWAPYPDMQAQGRTFRQPVQHEESGGRYAQ